MSVVKRCPMPDTYLTRIKENYQFIKSHVSAEHLTPRLFQESVITHDETRFLDNLSRDKGIVELINILFTRGEHGFYEFLEALRASGYVEVVARLTKERSKDERTSKNKKDEKVKKETMPDQEKISKKFYRNEMLPLQNKKETKMRKNYSQNENKTEKCMCGSQKTDKAGGRKQNSQIAGENETSRKGQQSSNETQTVPQIRGQTSDTKYSTVAYDIPDAQTMPEMKKNSTDGVTSQHSKFTYSWPVRDFASRRQPRSGTAAFDKQQYENLKGTKTHETTTRQHLPYEWPPRRN